MKRLANLAVALAALLTLAPLTAGADDEIRYTIRPGDTLIALSQKMLINPRQWPWIQKLNGITDPYHLIPGSALRMPVALLKLESATARVRSVSGEVSADGRPLKPADTIAPNAHITTGAQGFVTIELIDGSRLVLQPESSLKVEMLSRYRNTDLPETRLRLDAGRVESVVTKSLAPRPKYIINTPTAAIGVRGTSFRVGSEGANGASRAEVTEGTVAVGRDDAKESAPLHAGFGIVAEPGGAISAPVALLPAPDLSGQPALYERPVIRFVLPPLAGAQSYRFQVGADADLQVLLADTTASQPEAKFGGLPDGEYTLRVRGIDAKGLEGRDADFRFRLKARPQPPFATAPVGNVKLRAVSAALAWTTNPDAARYRVQVTHDEAFARIFADIDGVEGTTIMPASKLPPGDYLWRTRSIRADGDVGPWGDPQRFRLRALPAAPEPPKLDDHELTLAWSGEPGQTFLFQFARDDKFTDLVAERELTEASITLPRPQPDTYYMRVRATDADGFVGPFTDTQIVEVPYPRPPWWLPLLALVPLAL
ncbi:MAG: FecR domain-containing protein [Gammaproteobacteria bacterium]|nr:FecR domain-containing protein [Gammaproteobacteria bacterium]MBU1416537.1 FecR domain-containing protein [Gammaproteobacteria bacterium]